MRAAVVSLRFQGAAGLSSGGVAGVGFLRFALVDLARTVGPTAALGEHTADALSSAGVEPAAIDRLVSAGASKL